MFTGCNFSHPAPACSGCIHVRSCTCLLPLPLIIHILPHVLLVRFQLGRDRRHPSQYREFRLQHRDHLALVLHYRLQLSDAQLEAGEARHCSRARRRRPEAPGPGFECRQCAGMRRGGGAAPCSPYPIIPTEYGTPVAAYPSYTESSPTQGVEAPAAGAWHCRVTQVSVPFFGGESSYRAGRRGTCAGGCVANAWQVGPASRVSEGEGGRGSAQGVEAPAAGSVHINSIRAPNNSLFA